MSHDFTRLDMIKIELATKYDAKLEKAGNFLERSEVISDLISEAMDAASLSAQVTDSEIEKAAEEKNKMIDFAEWIFNYCEKVTDDDGILFYYYDKQTDMTEKYSVPKLLEIYSPDKSMTLDSGFKDFMGVTEKLEIVSTDLYFSRYGSDPAAPSIIYSGSKKSCEIFIEGAKWLRSQLNTGASQNIKP